MLKVVSEFPFTVLLATAIVRIRSTNNFELTARALLDQGSEISFISESLAQKLHLKRHQATLPIIGIGAQPSGSTKGVTNFKILPHFASHFECDVTAYILPKLTTELPSALTTSSDWPHLRGITLADPSFMKPGHIDLVLGADLYGYLLESDILKGDIYSPIAQRTSLGWIISGIINRDSKPNAVQSFKCIVDNDLSELLQRFWIQEEDHTPSNHLSIEENACEAHFVSTHSRNSSGRYVVRLPFRRSPKELGESKPAASQMLVRMLNKFLKNSEFHQLYADFLQEYENLGHMTQSLTENITSINGFYLPHHGVLRKSSSTTKLRVVFNGSYKTSSGVSLNDILHVGPKLQLDLSEVITRWRRFLYVFSADIEKMFRQVLVHPSDWAYQQILWSPSGSPQDHVSYMLQTVTYGLGPAPYLANRVLKQLTFDEGHQYPLAVDIIRNGTYVDDTFGGADTLEDAQQAALQLDALCKAGGFNLQKWTTNEAAVLSSIFTDRASRHPLKITDSPPVRTLGISWQPDADVFTFTSPFIHCSPPYTKRNVLSGIARLFDPLGWISPVTISAKIIMQELWLAKVNWDDPIPENLSTRWHNFLEDLNDISQLSIPRWIGTSSDKIGIEIHGFSDAYEHAMSSVLYIRLINLNNEIKISILEAKTKVAPLKRMTIPRLELTAALLLSKRAAHMQKSLNLTQVPIHLWTDSSVALIWISGHPSRWRDFVSNRVSKIQHITPLAHWHHVAGKDNPADCASRGIPVRQLINHALWWKGPSWLSSHSSLWPTSKVLVKSDINLEEKPKIASHSHLHEAVTIWELINRYSTLTRLVRITAICRRLFLRNSRSLFQHPLTPLELENERLFWVKTTQQAFFKLEMQILSQRRELPSSNALCKLIPFIDASGLLRLGGRLRNALLDPNTKHPYLLPRESALTTLILADAHEKTLDGGAQIMLAYLRQSYWILGGRTPVKSYVLRCVRCARLRGITAKQLMGQLPSERSNPSRPFLHTGVDYAGPLLIKTWKGRSAKSYKGYIVLFVCLSTSAIHLEVASDYTVEGFLAAYKRFIARRGICATLHSDCGTNFVGADSELKKLFAKTSDTIGKLCTLLAGDGTEWKFNPPSAPHFGGKWEAGVKSVKFHLKRIIGETSLTFEELTTLLSQIEAVLNSRPLCPLSDDPADINALTPGHFLIGTALTTIPEPALSDLPLSRLSRWQLIRQMLDHFWDRWSKEYLQRFQAISKWKQQTNLIQPGNLVHVADERYPPTKWPLGRILEVHPGADGLVRVATVKTQTSTFKRPIVKLCPLPIQTSFQPS